MKKKKKRIILFLVFFSELVSVRPAYIADEFRRPQSACSNGTDLYYFHVVHLSVCDALEFVVNKNV